MTYVDHTDGSFSLRVGNRAVHVRVDDGERELFRDWLDDVTHRRPSAEDRELAQLRRMWDAGEEAVSE